MPRKPSENPVANGDISGHAMEAFGAMNGVLGAAADRSRAAFAQGAQAWQEESLRFLSERLRRDGQTLDELRNCRTYAEMLQVQHRWMFDAGQSYADEAVRLSRLVAEIAQSGFGGSVEAGSEATAKAA